MPISNIKDREEITIEFYHKTAVYKSRITGARVPIVIKEVWKCRVRAGLYQTVIISDHGNHYALEELILPS